MKNAGIWPQEEVNPRETLVRIDGKVSAYSMGDQGLRPASEQVPCRKRKQPSPVFLAIHGWRSVIGYSPWGPQRDRTGDFTLA